MLFVQPFLLSKGGENMATVGIGSLFRRWDGAGNWENVGEITNITISGLSIDMLDSTNLGNTDRYMTFIAGMVDPGDLTLSMNFTRDEYDTMKSDAENSDNQNYELVLSDSDNSSWEFEGHVSSLTGPNVEPNGIITSECTIKISGKPNTESGSGPSAGA
jgi:hypothetical protein